MSRMPEHLGNASGGGGAADTDAGMLTAPRWLRGPLRAMTHGARRCRHSAMATPPAAACRRVAAKGAWAVECARSVCAVFRGTGQRASALHTHSAVSPAGLRTPVSGGGGGGGGSGGLSGRMLRARTCLAPASAGARSPWRRVLVLGGAVVMCAGVAAAAPTAGADAFRCISMVTGVCCEGTFSPRSATAGRRPRAAE